MNKKSQVEIMGLIVIVILIAVAMIFVLQFTITRRPASVKTFSHAELAENMLTTLRYTTTECNSLTMSELFKKCVEQDQEVCPNGQNYCAFVDAKADFFFRETLEKWNRPYIFSAVVANEYNITKTPANPNLRCTGERRSATHIMSVAGTIMNIRLDVCD